MPKTIKNDLAGQRFGRRVVLARGPDSSQGVARWRWRCDCGKFGVAFAANLRNFISCGCHRVEFMGQRDRTHGRSHTSMHRTWASMRQRCENQNNPAYPRYGGRGIKVCKRWRIFENFLADMGERPSGKRTLERKDNDGPYSKANCVWATKKDQARNRRNNRRVTFQNATRTVAEWAELLGFNPFAIYRRLSSGWSAERALTTPVRKRGAP